MRIPWKDGMRILQGNGMRMSQEDGVRICQEDGMRIVHQIELASFMNEIMRDLVQEREEDRAILLRQLDIRKELLELEKKELDRKIRDDRRDSKISRLQLTAKEAEIRIMADLSLTWE